eukprot:TRINITY_DN22984_c0_g1_i1.p1 TRINITY_DN22984_c0_g1~~TRINITY_DN22984_c0_g1_i1.p1  ORF type:complete len:235 (+),score=38.34 TRINITY_DN22984_c0_g1_i1:46-750(+)
MYLFTFIALLVSILVWLGKNRTKVKDPRVGGDELVVVIAHPDDEGMFMAPALESMREWYKKIRIVCVCNGNAAGLGETRVKELSESAKIFGIHHNDVTVISDPRFKDGLQEEWPVEALAETIKRNIPHPSHILTFDPYGVSSHPNHIAVSHACSALKSTKSVKTLFQVLTVPLYLKFTSCLTGSVSLGGDITLTAPTPASCWRSMLCHWSQMVWYRWLFIAFSRYSFAVDLLVF